ncbi:MAG: DUF4167 domain-containing protein [Pseudomonadota bacterium]
MRSSQKSGRSRGKGNRGKSQGHSPNRVYESAGPEGKVRGTPQQIIDKYTALARDAQLSGDRVGAENFLQHAEHYVRILVAAQEAAAERRDQQQPQQQQQQPQGGQAPQDTQPAAAQTEEQPASDGLGAIEAAQGQPDLVETPESQSAQPKPRTRRPRPKPAADPAPAPDAPPADDAPVEAAE